MRRRCQVRRLSLVIMAAAATGLYGVGPAADTVAAARPTAVRPGTATAVAACRGWRVVPTPGQGTGRPPVGVAVVPHTSRAWAIGSFGLILHWNGTRWTQVPSPDPNAIMHGVTAISHSDAWAVGDEILHWNGTSWKRQHDPDPNVELSGVAATSRRNAWAVGPNFGPPRALILHWNGTSWTKQRTGGDLRAVAAVSATDAWAVGDSGFHSLHSATRILHWNGKAWKKVPSPNGENPHHSQDRLYGVAATSARNAWAVGTATRAPNADSAFIEHWNGKQWKLVPNAAPAYSALDGVAATSARNAWAVGGTRSGPLIEHWNGKRWKLVPSPQTEFSDTVLLSVAASATRNLAWAVGSSINLDSVSLYHC